MYPDNADEAYANDRYDEGYNAGYGRGYDDGWAAGLREEG